jgi:hypothetical protein
MRTRGTSKPMRTCNVSSLTFDTARNRNTQQSLQLVLVLVLGQASSLSQPLAVV